MKRIIAVLLALIVLFSICFECTVTSSAIAGVDDVVVVGVCLDLLALGVSIHSVSNFCKSQAFADFCTDIGQHVDSGISTVKRGGKLFLATTKLAWQDMCGWVKSKFSGRTETKDIEFETTVEAPPRTLTLADGGVVPYGYFMEYNFLIYKSLDTGNYIGVYCTAPVCGAQFLKTTIQFYCVGSGYKVKRVDCVNGSWTDISTSNMTYGITYKGQSGSVYNYSLSSSYDARPESFSLYRTIDRVTSTAGNIDTNYPPAETVPDVEETTTSTVTMTSQAEYYPGALDAVTEVIEDGEKILIAVPDNLIVEADPANPTLTTDIDAIADELAVTVPSDVKTYVQTNIASDVGTVDQIIENTPSAEIPGTAESDIETANKFRLPRSFLEGFPFSIPYSIYIGIQSFVAEPQAPVFNLPFSVPALGLNEDMVIDLNSWSSLARLCRALLSLVWVAGLAMACSRFIKR